MPHSDSGDRNQWSKSPKVLSLIIVGLAIVAVAERDIHNRASDEIRGNKLLWRLVSLNALGALAYLKWGRTPAVAP
jgi:hypothetical protein